MSGVEALRLSVPHPRRPGVVEVLLWGSLILHQACVVHFDWLSFGVRGYAPLLTPKLHFPSSFVKFCELGG